MVQADRGVVGLKGWSLGRFLSILRPGSFVLPLVITLLITLVYQSAHFLETWKASAVQAEQLRTATLAAQVEALNAQINPHFLFNSLNVLSALVRREEGVTLERELAALRAYGALLTARFGERLRLGIAVAPRADAYVVPLALQMLVENAVKHNGATAARPLTVAVSERGGWVVVGNDVYSLFEPAEGKGVGLDNIRERYRLAAGRAIRVEAGAGRFAVWLPLITD